MAKKKKKIVTAMRRFQLHRDEDETGISGTGIVAEGVEFSNGTVAFTWLTHQHCVNIYSSMKTVEEIHGHGGKTRIVYVDPNINAQEEAA